MWRMGPSMTINLDVRSTFTNHIGVDEYQKVEVTQVFIVAYVDAIPMVTVLLSIGSASLVDVACT